MSDVVSLDPIEGVMKPQHPTHEEIAQLAHQLWVDSGELEGADKEHWRTAEDTVWTAYVRAKDAAGCE